MISKVSTFLGPNGLYRSGATPSLVLSLDSTNSMSYPPTGFTVSGGGTTHILDERNDITWDGYGGNYLQGGVFQDSVTPLAGWYLVDDNGTIRQVLGDSVWFSGGNPTPILNGGGWFMVLDGPYTISNTYSTSITFYESLPTVSNLYNGSNWFDISKRKNNGLLNDITPLVGGDLFPVSLSFNGTGSYISFTQSDGIPLGNSNYTIEAWINSNSYGPSEQGSIVGWGTTGVDNATNVLRLNGNGITNYWWNDDIPVEFSGTSSMIVGNWYHVAATYDGTNRKLYLNGESKSTDTPTGIHSVVDSSNLKIGYFYTNYFNGKISNVKISDKALSDVKILSNFNTDKVKYGYEFGSMTFNDAQSSYLISSSSDYAFGTNDFTIEAFFKSTATSSYEYSGIVSLKDNVSSYGVGINLQSANTANPLIEFSVGSLFIAPSPGTGLSLYYIRLIDGGSGNTMFNGFFYVDDSTHIVQTFYDLTNPTVDIKSTGGNGGPTFLYYPEWLCFDGGGCNITSFPYLYGSTQGDYNLYGNPASSTGNNVDSFLNVTYEFSTTPITTSTISYTASYTASNDRWYHVAISRTGGTSSFFVDGQLFNEVADTSNYGNNNLSIGRYYTNLSDHYFNGIISNVRIIKGTGLYSGSIITIPSEKLTPITNTKFLINSQKTTPSADLSGNLQSVTASNIGWTSSLPNVYVTDGLICYLDNYTGGSTWYDLSGNENNATLYNGYSYNSTNGGVVRFDGVGIQNNISSTSRGEINLDLSTTPCTIMYGTRYLQNTPGYIPSGRSLGGKNNNWLLGTWANSVNQFFIDSGGWVYGATPNTPDMNWHIYTGTVNGPVKFWNNGTKLIELGPNGDGPNGIVLGSDSYGEASNCDIAFVLVYNRVLSDSEIELNFNNFRGRFGL